MLNLNSDKRSLPLSIINELKRRNVFKVGIAYVVAAWLLLQLTEVLVGLLGLPENAGKYVILLLVIGFPVALFCAWAFELTPEGIKKEKDVDRSQSITKQTGRKLDFVIIGVMTAALAYFAYDKLVLSSVRDAALIEATTQAMTEQTASESAPAQVDKSIAVLPFVNMSDDASNEYFSDGISEEILNALAKVQGLQVAGRTSSFAFKGQNQDLRRIGEALGVNHILEGSVRKAGDTVRITAQLVRVDNGFHLWSESYDRKLDDVFAIQDEISNAILVQLKAHLMGEEPKTVVSARTNSQAYDLYLLARQRIYERAQLPLESAAELLDQAIALDPNYAPAYAQRGITAILLADNAYGNIPWKQANASARLYLDQALRLDPELAEAWAGLGLYYSNYPGKSAEQIETLEKALAINPNLIDAANWLNIAKIDSNQPAAARKILEDMMQRDPLYKPGIGNLVFIHIQMGDIEKAREVVEKARPFMPTDETILQADSMVLLAQGQLAEGLRLAEAAVQLRPNDRVARIFMSMLLGQTHQYERLATEGYKGLRIWGLSHLGRSEEAMIMAQKLASDGSVSRLFELLNSSGQSTELVRYLEETWPDLDDFQLDFSSSGYTGYRVMLDIALAYKRVGNQEKFGDAMARLRTAHDSLAEQGLSNGIFFANEAMYYSMAQQAETALQFLAAAVDSGQVYSARIADDMPQLSELEGMPEYEAIQSRMLEHLNSERGKLGLEPVST